MFWSSEQHLWIGGNEVNVAGWYTPCAECERAEANLNSFLMRMSCFFWIKSRIYGEKKKKNTFVKWFVTFQIKAMKTKTWISVLNLCLSWDHQSPTAWISIREGTKQVLCQAQLKEPTCWKAAFSENKSSSCCGSYKSEWKGRKIHSCALNILEVCFSSNDC